MVLHGIPLNSWFNGRLHQSHASWNTTYHFRRASQPGTNLSPANSPRFSTPGHSRLNSRHPAKLLPLIFFEMSIVYCTRAYYLCSNKQLFPVSVVNQC